MEININQITSKRSLQQMGVAALIEKAGGVMNMLRMIDKGRAEGIMGRQAASKLRKLVRAVASDTTLLRTSEDSAELREKLDQLPAILQAY